MSLTPTGILGAVAVGATIGTGLHFLTSASPEVAVAMGAGAAVLLLAGQALIPQEPELKVSSEKPSKKDKEKANKKKQQKTAKAQQEYQQLLQEEKEKAKAKAQEAEKEEPEAAPAAQKEGSKKKKNKKKASEKTEQAAPAPAPTKAQPQQQQQQAQKQQQQKPEQKAEQKKGAAKNATAPAPAPAKATQQPQQKGKQGQQQQQQQQQGQKQVAQQQQKAAAAPAPAPAAEEKNASASSKKAAKKKAKKAEKAAAAAAATAAAESTAAVEEEDSKANGVSDDDGEWEVQRSKASKRAQHHQQQHVQTAAATAADEVVPIPPKPEEVTAEVRVDAKLHGRILGAGGSTLQKLEAITGAKINVPRKEERSERIKITGTAGAVAAAKEAIEELVSKGFATLLLNPDEISRELRIESRHQAIVIGRGGAHIQKIQQKLGVRINMPEKKQEGKRGANVNDEWVTLNLVGTPEAVSAAWTAITQLINDGFSAVTHEGWTSVKLSVPKAEIGAVIGQRGKKIQKLQEETRTRINIANDAVGDEITVSIAGLPGDVAAAEAQIREAVEESLREKAALEEADDPAWMNVQEPEW